MTVAKQLRHIERKKTIREIVRVTEMDSRVVRRIASTLSGAQLNQWLKFEQRQAERIWLMPEALHSERDSAGIDSARPAASDVQVLRHSDTKPVGLAKECASASAYRSRSLRL